MEPYVKSKLGHKVYMSQFRSNRSGVMIHLNNNFDQQVESIKTDPNGNYTILNKTIQGKRVTLVNIYGPNEDNPQFYQNMIEKKHPNLTMKFKLCVELKFCTKS